MANTTPPRFWIAVHGGLPAIEAEICKYPHTVGKAPIEVQLFLVEHAASCHVRRSALEAVVGEMMYRWVNRKPDSLERQRLRAFVAGVLAKAAHDPESIVRTFVAEQDWTPPETLRELLRTSWFWDSHPQTPNDQRARRAHPDAMTAAAVLWNAATPTDVLASLTPLEFDPRKPAAQETGAPLRQALANWIQATTPTGTPEATVADVLRRMVAAAKDIHTSQDDFFPPSIMVQRLGRLLLVFRRRALGEGVTYLPSGRPWANKHTRADVLDHVDTMAIRLPESYPVPSQ